MDIPISPEVGYFVAGAAVVSAMLGYVAVSARHLRIIRGEVTPNGGASLADRLDAEIELGRIEHRELKDAIGVVHRRVDEIMAALLRRG